MNGTIDLATFAEALASPSPAPGGSAAAAVPGALAAGLVAMVARLTAESDPFGDRAVDMDAVAEEADRLRGELLALVDEDAKAFDGVLAALRTTARPEEIQGAFEAAVEPPMRVCTCSLRVLELAAEVVEHGAPHAASDAGVAVLLAAASLDAAALTARVELRPVEDRTFCAARAETLTEAQLRGRMLAESARRFSSGVSESISSV